MSLGSNKKAFHIRAITGLSHAFEGVWIRCGASNTRFNFAQRRVEFALLVIALFVAATCALIWSLRKDVAAESKLWRRFNEGLTTDDYGKARLAVDQLIELDQHDVERQFQLALLEAKLGEPATANLIVDRLVEARFVRAAIWKLNRKYSHQRLKSLSKADTAEFIQLVKLARESPKDEERGIALRYAAAYLQETGKLRQAIPYLLELATLDNAFNLNLARLYASLGMKQEVLKYAEIARGFYAAELAASPKEPVFQLGLISALTLLEREREAVLMATGCFQQNQDERFQQAGANAMLAWETRLKGRRQSSSLLCSRAELLHRASQCAPNDRTVARAIIAFLVECAMGADSERHFEKGLATGCDSESIHFMLGTLNLFKQNWNEADLELSIAENFGSIVPLVLANLLVEYASQQPANSRRAISIASHLVARYPNDSAVLAAYKSIRRNTLPQAP